MISLHLFLLLQNTAKSNTLTKIKYKILVKHYGQVLPGFYILFP